MTIQNEKKEKMNKFLLASLLMAASSTALFTGNAYAADKDQAKTGQEEMISANSQAADHAKKASKQADKAAKSAGEATKEALKNAGTATEKAAQNASEEAKDAAQNASKEAKKAAHKAAKAAKKAAAHAKKQAKKAAKEASDEEHAFLGHTGIVLAPGPVRLDKNGKPVQPKMPSAAEERRENIQMKSDIEYLNAGHKPKTNQQRALARFTPHDRELILKRANEALAASAK